MTLPARRTALVVPTCRPELFRDFLDAWEPVRFWDDLVVVEDGPERTFDAGTPHHASHAEIRADLGHDAWVISRRDSAVRSYGFLLAHRLGAEYVLTLDDDTRPVPGVDHLAGHLAALNASPQWESSVPGLRVRGLPYGRLGALGDVRLNVGLWRGVPDLDGMTSLVQGCPRDFAPPPGSRVVPRGRYLPVCGMNLAFTRDFTPLAYFGLQGEGWPYRRFDDIWMGVVAKKVCDHLGWSVAVGDPHVRHDRASDPMANMVKEAPGVALHERLWRLVDSMTLTADTAAGCLTEVGAAFESSLDVPAEASGYLAQLGRAMQVWAGFFRDSD